MAVTKFIKTPKLFEYIELEVSEALHRHDIRDMFDYAWVGEDTPSDEFVGLAMLTRTIHTQATFRIVGIGDHHFGQYFQQRPFDNFFRIDRNISH